MGQTLLGALIGRAWSFFFETCAVARVESRLSPLWLVSPDLDCQVINQLLHVFMGCGLFPFRISAQDPSSVIQQKRKEKK